MFLQQHELKDRTKQFALRILKLADALPNKPGAWVISKQVLRSATSIAANYRAVSRSRSRAEFVAKMGVVVEETDETLFWLEMLADSGLVRASQLDSLLREATELLAIFASSFRTARSRINPSNRPTVRSSD